MIVELRRLRMVDRMGKDTAQAETCGPPIRLHKFAE